MSSTEEAWNEGGQGGRVRSMGWKELYLKEDWWAIWLGLGIVIVAYLFFANGSSIKWIAVTPAKWAAAPAPAMIAFKPRCFAPVTYA